MMMLMLRLLLLLGSYFFLFPLASSLAEAQLIAIFVCLLHHYSSLLCELHSAILFLTLFSIRCGQKQIEMCHLFVIWRPRHCFSVALPGPL